MAVDLADAFVAGKEVDDADLDVVARHLERPGAGGLELQEPEGGAAETRQLQRFDRDLASVGVERVIPVPPDPRRPGHRPRAFLDLELLRANAGAFEVELRGRAFEGLAVGDPSSTSEGADPKRRFVVAVQVVFARDQAFNRPVVQLEGARRSAIGRRSSLTFALICSPPSLRG